MKKLVLALVAVSLASASYAGAGCAGGCSGEKPADKTTTEQSADGQKKA